MYWKNWMKTLVIFITFWAPSLAFRWQMFHPQSMSSSVQISRCWSSSLLKGLPWTLTLNFFEVLDLEFVPRFSPETHWLDLWPWNITVWLEKRDPFSCVPPFFISIMRKLFDSVPQRSGKLIQMWFLTCITCVPVLPTIRYICLPSECTRNPN